MTFFNKIKSYFKSKEQNVNSDNQISFPYEIRHYPGNEAFKAVMEQRERDNRLVLLGDLSSGILQTNLDEFEKTPQEIIEESKDLDAQRLFKQYIEASPESFEDIDIGEWPEKIQKQQITAHTDIPTGKPKKKVFVATIPTPHSYEIPAYLKLGGWNECPPPEELVAFFKYWENKYSARIISATGDVIECIVDNPPKTREEAMALANEQYIICSDIVTQGVETISNLAAHLLNGNTWFFWWD